MESWRQVFRVGFLPQATTAGLLKLRAALVSGDQRLLKGRTTEPPPLLTVLDWPCEGGCPVATLFTERLYDAQKPATVGDAEDAFGAACHRADVLLGEPAATRWFTASWDEGDFTARDLVAEIDRALTGRGVEAA